MSCAIVINLDYDNHSEEACQEVWDAIKAKMLEAGFRLDNRVFIINRDQKETCDLARHVIEGMEEHLEFDKKHVFGPVPELKLQIFLNDMYNIAIRGRKRKYQTFHPEPLYEKIDHLLSEIE